MIATLLIANRGEIACRIIRTARRMGIRTVAVYSDADRDALHVGAADIAVRVGGDAPTASYLRGEAVIAAALASGADAIHPGYGFLSENAAFARACVEAGLTFVGPSAAAIEAMGDKAHAKTLMRRAGVPVVPGYEGADQSRNRFAAEALRIGYPVLVKAASGGGGRGMRRVDKPEDLGAAIESARREAENAFGNGSLLLEKLVTDARHIEIQICADSHGNIVHLGERDCSSQRRHQKIIEETPSPFLDPAAREAMTVAAIAAAQAVDYVGAGTVEFIVGMDRSFHFLEMNTRLQVEHPATEMVTGIDLVEWQLVVASGGALPLHQDAISFSGHAIEARLCAEDPYAGFTPQTGDVLFWQPEASAGDHVRIDHGIREGLAVTPYYDPMIAKVVAVGQTRQEAIARLRNAMLAAPLIGVVTNRGFLLSLLDDPLFVSGGMTTSAVDARMEAGEFERAPVTPTDVALAAFVAAHPADADWFSSTGRARCPVDLQCGEQSFRCHVRFTRGRFDGVEIEGQAVALQVLSIDGNHLTFLAEERAERALVIRRDGTIRLDRGGCTFVFTEPDALAAKPSRDDETSVIAPVSGLLRDVSAEVGEQVRRGQVLAIIEAMKMETKLVAPIAGRVSIVRARSGDQVGMGDRLIDIEAE